MMRMDLDEPSTQAASLEASPTQKKKKKRTKSKFRNVNRIGGKELKK